MRNKAKRMIKVYGITEKYPINSKTFKQFQVQEIIILPDNYPEIKKIISVTGNIEIKNKQIIHCSEGISNEGQKLKGLKLIVDGNINQKIEYLGNNCQNTIHVYNLSIPFCNFIVLDKGIRAIDYDVIVTGYLEDIYIRPLSSRKIIQKTSILINALIPFNV